MKVNKLLSIGTICYLIVFVFDWIATLFSLGNSNEVVQSFLGVRIEQYVQNNTLELQTSLLPRAIIIYVIFIAIIICIYYVQKGLKNKV